MAIEMTKVSEAKRTYTFEDGNKFVVKDVVEFGMPGSTHRLRTKNGDLVIVKPNWRHIVIEGSEEFTV